MNDHKHYYSVRVLNDGTTTTIALSGEIDAAAAPDVRVVLAALSNGDTAPARLVIDLSGTTFIGSSGVNVLVSAYRAAASAGADFQLVSAPAVDRVLAMCGVAFDLVEAEAVSGSTARNEQ